MSAPDIRSALGSVQAALAMLGDEEDRVVRATLQGQRARLSFTTAAFATLRDTLLAAQEALEPKS